MKENKEYTPGLYDRQVRSTERAKSANVVNFNNIGNVLYLNREVLNSINLELIPFTSNGKIGFINRLAEVVVEAVFDEIKGVMRTKENFVAVRKGKDWTVINSEGDEVLKHVKHMIIPGYDCPLVSIQNQSKSKVVNVITNETIVDSQYDYIDGFRYGFARVRIGNNTSGKWGIINENGDLVLPTEYAAIYSFYDFPIPRTVLRAIKDGPEQFTQLSSLQIK